MSKHKGKRNIEDPSARGQRAARRIAATNKIQPKAVARANEHPTLTETGGEIFPSGVMLDLIRDAAMIKSNSYAQMSRTFRSQIVSS
jgi:hypothetical protein